ncbi:MAG: hypothetical protein Q9186_006974 [Xanthomendoza sp. 1 TL-2023]
MARWQSHKPLSILLPLVLATFAGAHEHQSVAITLDPGQSIIESFQLTLPVVATTTAVSMVTVTQMSMQTTTVRNGQLADEKPMLICSLKAVVVQMQTVTIAGTCAATTQVAASQSVQEVVTAGALDPIVATPAISPTIPSPSSSTASPPDSSASTAVLAPSESPSGPCDCSCLCPMAAFPMVAYQMVANTTQVVATSTSQMSTFQTMASADLANKVVVSSASGLLSTSGAEATSSAIGSSASQSGPIPTLTSGVLPSVIVTDPGTATGQAQQKNAQDAPFIIDNYSLMKSVSLPVIMGRAVEPTAGV